MDFDLKDRDKTVLFLVYPVVIGFLALLLGIIYTQSGYL